jgi:hypothetical protein
MFWREGELESPGAPISEPCSCLLGDVSRMIIEDQVDRRMGRIGDGIQPLVPELLVHIWEPRVADESLPSDNLHGIDRLVDKLSTLRLRRGFFLKSKVLRWENNPHVAITLIAGVARHAAWKSLRSGEMNVTYHSSGYTPPAGNEVDQDRRRHDPQDWRWRARSPGAANNNPDARNERSRSRLRHSKTTI